MDRKGLPQPLAALLRARTPNTRALAGFAANGGEVGTHAVVCWSKSRGVPDKATPGPGRWLMRGTGYADLTLDAEPGKSRSVLLLGGCAWHGFVTNGDVT